MVAQTPPKRLVWVRVLWNLHCIRIAQMDRATAPEPAVCREFEPLCEYNTPLWYKGLLRPTVSRLISVRFRVEALDPILKWLKRTGRNPVIYRWFESDWGLQSRGVAKWKGRGI